MQLGLNLNALGLSDC